MDDEDHVWLEQVNNERQTIDGCDPVTHDQLEGIIDRLEKESIFETNSKNKRDLDDTEAVCCVCNDGEVNLLLIYREKIKFKIIYIFFSATTRIKSFSAICAIWPCIKSATACPTFPRVNGSVVVAPFPLPDRLIVLHGKFFFQESSSFWENFPKIIRPSIFSSLLSN